jgi:hypothetical protein
MENFEISEYLKKPHPLAPRIYRIESLKGVGGWSVSDIYQGRLFEDVYIISAISKHRSMMHLDKIIYHRRLRERSVSHTSKDTYAKWHQWLINELMLR